MEQILTLCHILQSAGHQCLMVGGAVRNQLRGEKAQDYDLATPASVEEMLALFKDHHYTIVPTGLKHGTLTLVMQGQHFELSTFRGKNLEEDSTHRDFTINAIFYDPMTQKYFDPQNGTKDLEKKILRYVGKPQERIDEDPLRAFRFFRFLSTLDLSPEEQSLNTSLECFPSVLKTVSVERLRDELMKLLSGRAFDKVLKGFPSLFSKLLTQGKPERALKELPEDRPFLRLASFYDDHPQADMEFLKFSHREMKYVNFIVEQVRKLPFYKSKKEVRRLVVKAQGLFADEAFFVLRDLSLISKLRGQNTIELEEELKSAPWNYKSPLDGYELQELTGPVQGKILGELKEFLLDQVLEENISFEDKGKARELVLDYLKNK